MTQVFVLCGLYFIISSFLGIFVGGISHFSALVFLLFLPGVVVITIFKSFSFVATLKDKYPSLTILLNILGVYVVIYFIRNLLGILGEALCENKILNCQVREYAEWEEFLAAMIDIVFFMILMLSLIFILVRKISEVSSF